MPRGEVAERGPHGLPKLWLTWVVRNNGLVTLRAVSISHEHKKYAAGVAEHEKEEEVGQNPIIRWWQEEVEADHLFAQEETLALASMAVPKPRRT